MTMLKAVFAGLVAVSSLVATISIAQEYPSKPVRLIVTFPPGGGADMLARALGKQLGDRWKQSVIIDNRGGGDGAIGAAVAAKTPPDGYTLLMVISTHTVLPHIKKSLQYDIVQDFTPVIRMAEAPNIVVAHPLLPARSIPELIVLAKKNPGKLDYPGSGYGGPAHLAGVLFDQFAGTKLNFIPYKGTGPSLIALIGGHVTIMFPAITGALPHVRAGKIRALGVTSEKRYSQMPDLPTVGETLKGYAFVGWYGLVSRAGTPAAIVDKVYADTAAALGSEEIREFLASGGLTAAIQKPAEFGHYIGSEIKHTAKLVASAGLTRD